MQVEEENRLKEEKLKSKKGFKKSKKERKNRNRKKASIVDELEEIAKEMGRNNTSNDFGTREQRERILEKENKRKERIAKERGQAFEVC